MLGYKTSDSRGNVLSTSLSSQNVVHVYDIAAKSLYIICPAKGENKEGLCFQKKFSRGLVRINVENKRGVYLPRIYLMECIPCSMVRGKILSSQCQYLL